MKDKLKSYEECRKRYKLGELTSREAAEEYEDVACASRSRRLHKVRERAGGGGQVHLPVSGECRRHVQFVAFLRVARAPQLRRTVAVQRAEYGARIRRGQKTAEVPRQLSEYIVGGDSSYFYTARIHRRQQFQVLTFGRRRTGRQGTDVP